ncbi:MAG: hypothetical protein P0Y53_05485 [Candidatus Pseudobacter hemicellulosilyticus]|uniref:Lipoprotein n=1 Tax=Candidatus Pseudobacter hemicellulosilyticus TaxID=3121375 RepID=A0AAJ6BH89_9BACT|nr:MAG: hypothetical protein P0Y53_05485 [Pseudobacter sp.]
MKYILTGGLLFSILLTGCSNNEQSAAEAPAGEDSVVVEDNTILSPEIVQVFGKAGLTDFARSRVPAFNWNQFSITTTWEEDSALSSSFTPGKDYYTEYGPYLKYSPDSTRFIDLDSYNVHIRKKGDGQTEIAESGPDTEVSLVNRQTGQKTRLLFLGPAGSIDDAFWESNDRIVVVGAQETAPAAGRRLTVWTIDLPAYSYQLYELPDTAAAKLLTGQWRKERLKKGLNK